MGIFDWQWNAMDLDRLTGSSGDDTAEWKEHDGSEVVTFKTVRSTLSMLALGAILAVGLAGPASAGYVLNGMTMNGLSFNGLTMNGMWFNGYWFNGYAFNGVDMGGLSLDGVILSEESR